MLILETFLEPVDAWCAKAFLIGFVSMHGIRHRIPEVKRSDHVCGVKFPIKQDQAGFYACTMHTLNEFTHRISIYRVLCHVQDCKVQPRSCVDALGRDVCLKHVRAALALAAHQLVFSFFAVSWCEVLVYGYDGSFWKSACRFDDGNLF